MCWHLTSKGLLAKLKQADYALSQLEKCTKEVADDVSIKDSFPIKDKVQFFSDSFWAFLRASLDVLAQIINQTNKLGLDEKDTSFNQVVQKQTNKQRASPLTAQLNKLKGSTYFKNADRYRNCSLHRRQIYLEKRVTEIEPTNGYSISGPLRTSSWLICDNPLVVRPKTEQGRDLSSYCKKCKVRIEESTNRIVKLLIQ